MQHGPDGAAASEVLRGCGADGAAERTSRPASPVIDGVVLDSHIVAILALFRNVPSAHRSDNSKSCSSVTQHGYLWAPWILGDSVIWVLEIDVRVEFVSLWKPVPTQVGDSVLGRERAQHLDSLAFEVLGRGRANSAIERSVRAAAPAIDSIVLNTHVVSVLPLLSPHLYATE